MNVSPCPDCAAASISHHHGYTAECNGCKARAIARSPIFFRVARMVSAPADKGAYRIALRLVGVKHAEVMAAATADRLCDRLKNGPP